MKILILGMGNPILSDDGVGLRVAKRLEGADVVTTATVGLNLMDIIVDYDVMFLIDAVTTRGGRVGDLKKLTLDDGALHLYSSHGVNFNELHELGVRLGLKMPAIGAIYGIGIGDCVEFSEKFSPALEGRIDSIVSDITADIRNSLKTEMQNSK